MWFITMQDQELKAVNEALSSFPTVTYEEWRSRAEKTLRGKPLTSLLTNTYEEITIKPLYEQRNSYAGNPFLFKQDPSMNHEKRKPWIIQQENRYETAADVNEALRQDLANGQTGIHIVLADAMKAVHVAHREAFVQDSHNGLFISNVADIERVFQHVNLSQYPLFIETGASAIPFFVTFVAYLQANDIPLQSIRGAIGADPLTAFVANGSLSYPLQSTYDFLSQMTRWTKKSMANLHTIIIDGARYCNGGGSAVEELAFSFATAVEYIRQLHKRDVLIDDAARTITFSYAISANLFMEVAKFRAARLIWAKIVRAFGGNRESQKMTIHASTATWNKTLYDPHVNSLRGAIEAFTGAVGGVDSMHVAPFDDPFRTPTEFTRRVARNTQLILQEEVQLGEVIDPTAGSWYVEALTEALAEKAWELFQQIEAKGGMEKALKDGFPQHIIRKLANRRLENIQKRKDILVGTNKFVNPNEQSLEKVTETKQPSQKSRRLDKKKQLDEKIPTFYSHSNELIADALTLATKGASLGTIASALGETNEDASIERIDLRRMAEPFENIRLTTERYVLAKEVRPKLLLAIYGSVAHHRAGADFARDFFEVSGFSILTNTGFTTVADIAKAASDIEANTVVVVSSEEGYKEILPELLTSLRKLNEKLPVYVIGKLRDEVMKNYKELGLEAVINENSNAHDVLVSLQKRIGVRT